MSSVPSAPRRLPQHGTVAGYNAGFDCRPCKRARANYSTARYQAKRRAQREQQLARRDLVIDAVRQYRQAGWTPFPLPAASKFPPPRGITGASGRPVTDADYADWVDQWANVGLVLPDGVIGLDLDLYKPGDAVADGLRRRSGSPAATMAVACTCQGRPRHEAEGTIEGLGEVVQRTHRYVVAPPSLHPEGRVYKWLNDDDEEAGIPSIDSLSWLPEIWLRRLQDRPASRRSGKGFKGDAEAWFDTLQRGPMTPAVRTTLRESARELERHSVSGEARYDVMVRGISRLVGLGARRHRGVERAIDELYAAYVQAVEGTLGRDPESEIARALTGAIEKWGAQ